MAAHDVERPEREPSGLPALEVRGVHKSFAGVTVLQDVDLIVKPASVHAVVGHNGSGKSTLIKALAGFHQPDRDVVGTSFGQSFTVGDHASASRAGLRFVHQDLGLVDQMSTVDNIALGAGFPTRVGGTVRWSEAARRSRAAMEALGYDIDVTVPVGTLSAAECTGVAIARALQSWSGSPAVVLLDEPTAAMPSPEVRRLFDAVDRLRRQGLGVVFVSHHVDEVLELADDVTVLRDGKVVLSRPVAGLTNADLVTAIVGRQLGALSRTPDPDEVQLAGGAVLEVRDLRTPGVHGVSFAVRAGEIVGIAGIMGSGRDEVLPAVAGVIARGGSVCIRSMVVPPGRPRAAIRAGLGPVAADRRRSAVFPALSAGSNLTVSGVQQYVRLGLLNQRAERADVCGWFEQLEVLPANPDAPILTLSGGNQQKVMIGRWLRRAPAVLALDEPTQGVDVGARQTIYLSLQRAAEAGKGVVICSSDSDELASLCHRVVVLARGRIVAELTGTDIDPERIDALSLGDQEALV